MTKLIQFAVAGLFLCLGFVTQAQSFKPTLDQKCLGFAIYREADGESRKGQIAVGEVVKNRIRHGIADSACGVIRKRGQFAFNSKPWSINEIPTKRRIYFYIIAERVLEEERNLVLPENVLYFNNLPFRSRDYRLYAKIEHQLFYVKKTDD